MSLKMHRDIVSGFESGSAGELSMNDSFNFECDDRCMGRCCTNIKILLDPWDVESMARHLGIAGREFIDRYCALEEDPQTGWPYVKLADAEIGPCVFLMEDGKCTVYPARSRNCRTYPVGRAVRFLPDGKKEEKYFMVERQPFCLGFGSSRQWTLGQWLDDAESRKFYERSDLYFEMVSYAINQLECRRWMSGRTARMIMPFLYGPDLLREKMGISVEDVGHEEFHRRRIKAVKALLTDLAAGFGFGPLAVAAGGKELEDMGVMDRVKGILKSGE
ncbi:MAG: YkgJ family cysteine cluster protein [Bacillota bacterium]